jgi:hypothetical protein
MRRSLATVGVVAGLALTTAARAEDGFRCESGRLVSVGDHLPEVRAKCGDPDFADQRIEKRRETIKVRRFVGDRLEDVREEREVEIILDEWTYDMGPRKLVRYVYFENSRVVSTATGRRGSRKQD